MTLRYFWTPLWRDRLFLAAVLMLAGILRLWGIGFGLPSRSAKPDESDIIVRALAFGAGDLNPHFFNYPTLFMYLVFAGYILYVMVRMLIGQYTASDFLLECRVLPFSTHLIPRALSALAGVVTIWIVYRITLKLFDRTTARAAAFLLAIAHLHVRDSHFALTDVPMVCMIMVAMLFILRCYQQPTTWAWLLAGATAGLATSIKYNAVFLVAPILLTAALVYGARSMKSPGALRGLLICGAAFLFFFLLGTPYALLDWRQFISDLTTESQRVYADPARPLDRAWRVHSGVSLWYGLGWPVWIAAIVGLFYTARRLGKTAYVFLAFPVLYAIIAGVGYKAPCRYALPLVPFLCISAAMMISQLHAWSARLVAKPVAGLLAVLITLAAAVPSLACVIPSNRLFSAKDSRVEAAEWIQSHLPANSSVYQRPDSYGVIPLHEDLATLEHLRSDKGTPSSQRHLLKVEIPYLRRHHVPTYQLWNYDTTAGRFTFNGQPQGDLPDYVLIYKHPTQWKHAPLPEDLLKKRYMLLHTVEAYDELQADESIYSDGLYMPYARFKGTRCPGPNVYIYARTAHPEAAQ